MHCFCSTCYHKCPKHVLHFLQVQKQKIAHQLEKKHRPVCSVCEFSQLCQGDHHTTISGIWCAFRKNIVIRMGRAWHVENIFHSYQRASKGDFIFWENLNAYYQKSEQWIKVKFGGSSIASLNSSLTLNSTLNAHLVGKLYPLISSITSSDY